MRRFTAVLLAAALTLMGAGCQRTEEMPAVENVPQAEVSSADALEAESISENSQTLEETGRETAGETAEETRSVELVVYFTLGRNAAYPEDIDASTSASLVADGEELVGATEYVGRRIAEERGADLYSIRTVESYPSDFDEVVDQNHQEAAMELYPELTDTDLDVSGYETIFIGYPELVVHGADGHPLVFGRI